MDNRGNVLVVDDERPTRATLADILRLEGYTVVPVPDGPSALERLSQQEYDVVLLDLRMPGMNGLEVLERIRKAGWDVEVVLLTAHSSVESAIGALRHGAADYLIKPAHPDEIRAAVSKALERRRQRLKQRHLLEELMRTMHGEEGRGLNGGERQADERVSLSADAWVDFKRRRLHVGEEEVPLSPTEARLLNILLAHEGEVIAHQELVRLVQGYDVEAAEASEMLRPLVSRLRAKLGHIPGGRAWLVNVRGVGYLLERPS